MYFVAEKKRGTRVYLIRHAKTTAGDRIAGGASDVPLSGKGRTEADTLAQELHPVRFDLIVSSDLSRARVTAAPTAKANGLTVVTTSDLRERRYGGFEQRRKPDEIAEARGTLNDYWMNTNLKGRRLTRVVPGMETDESLIRRMTHRLSQLLDQYRGATIGVVGHADSLSRILPVIGAVESHEVYTFQNTGFVVVDFSSSGRADVVKAKGVERFS
jgi:2,3-bisphosphoglycerate-dependent phosphoglycerate mutase